ncbi:hypothetical protein N9N67_09010 [Bacteriovoracaceae bacterium]|nr:hypothetical protein [Bacteriovoracaceae bacterium]
MKLINQLLSFTLIYSLAIPTNLFSQTIPDFDETDNTGSAGSGIESNSLNPNDIKDKTVEELMKLGMTEEEAKESVQKSYVKYSEAKTSMKEFTDGTGSDFDSCTFHSNQDNWNIKSPSAKQAHAIYMGLWAAYNKDGKIGNSTFYQGGNGSATFNLNESLKDIGKKYKKSNDELIEKFQLADENFTCHCNAIKAIGTGSITSGDESQSGLNNYNANCGGVTENTDFTQITQTQDAEAAAKRHREMLINYLQTRKSLLAEQIVAYDEMFTDLNDLTTAVQEQEYQGLIEDEVLQHGSEPKEIVEKTLTNKHGMLVGEYHENYGEWVWGIPWFDFGSLPKSSMGSINVNGSQTTTSYENVPQYVLDQIEQCEEAGYNCDDILLQYEVTTTQIINPNERKILFGNWMDAQHIDEDVNPIQLNVKYNHDWNNVGFGFYKEHWNYHALYFTPYLSQKCGNTAFAPIIRTQEANKYYVGIPMNKSSNKTGLLAPGNFCVNEMYKFQDNGVDQYLLDPPFPAGFNSNPGVNVQEATTKLTRCIIEKNKEKYSKTSNPYFQNQASGYSLGEKPVKKNENDNVHVLAWDVISTCLEFDTYGTNPIPFKAPPITEQNQTQLKAQYSSIIQNNFPHVHESDLDEVADYVYKYHFIFPNKADSLKVVYPTPGKSLWIDLMGQAMEKVGDDALNSYENIDKLLGAYQDDYNVNFGVGGVYHGDGEIVVNESTGTLSKLPKITNIVTPGMANPGGVQDVGGQLNAGSRNKSGDFAAGNRLRGAIKKARELREQKKKDFLARSKDKKQAKKVLDSIGKFSNSFLQPLPAGGGTLGGQSNLATGALATGNNGNKAIKDRGAGEEEQKIGAHYSQGANGSGSDGYGYSSGSSYSNGGSGGSNSGLSSHSQQNILDNIDKQKHLYKSMDDDFLFVKVSKAYKRNLDRIFVRKKPKLSIKSPIDEKKSLKLDEKKKREISSILDD